MTVLQLYRPDFADEQLTRRLQAHLRRSGFEADKFQVSIERSVATLRVNRGELLLRWRMEQAARRVAGILDVRIIEVAEHVSRVSAGVRVNRSRRLKVFPLGQQVGAH